MKHISIFIVFFALFGLESSMAGEVSKEMHASVSNPMNTDGLICPFHKSFPRFETNEEPQERERIIANDDETFEI